MQVGILMIPSKARPRLPRYQKTATRPMLVKARFQMSFCIKLEAFTIIYLQHTIANHNAINMPDEVARESATKLSISMENHHVIR